LESVISILSSVDMPCKSTVIIDTGRFLNPMMYKQMIGRAGRRGYDTSGNVIFFKVSLERIANLVCSTLPSIQGSCAIDTSCTLRIMSMLSHAPRKLLPSLFDRVEILLSKPLQSFGAQSTELKEFFLFSLVLL
jgi:hypothetical protein